MGLRSEITFAGVGGQGLISAGNVLCLAAVTYADRNAAMSSEYGSETRGTFAKSDVIVSDTQIFYPEIETPSLLLVLDPIAYQRYEALQDETVVLIYDSDVVSANGKAPFKQIGVPFTTASRELGGAPVNMLSLGYITAMTNVVSGEDISAALEQLYGNREKTLLRNLNAFRAGAKLYSNGAQC